MKTTDLTDFPDRFSPMLVKELRQGMRARAFTAIFLGMQLLLGIMMLAAVLSADSERAGGAVSAIIFTFFIIAVVIIQPLRGIGALATEMRDQTIDLMALTRLTSWRIVTGKWVALVSQSLLMAVTFVPYLILRYFFGGMNLVGELVFLIWLMAVSMALTALTVGLSACRMAVARVLVPVGGGLVMFVMLMALSARSAMGGGGDFFMGFTPTGAEDWAGLLVFFGLIAYLGHQWLSMGASLIAPSAENHATLRRLVTLFGLILATGYVAFFLSAGDIEVTWFFCVLVLFVPAAIVALSESTVPAPSVVERFRRRGAVGMFGAVFLLPGPAAGYFFTLLMAAVCAISALCVGLDRMDDMIIWLFGVWGAVLFPAAVQCFSQRGEEQRIGGYLMRLIATLVLAAIVQALAGATGNDRLLLMFAWCPAVFAFGDVDGFKTTLGGLLIGGVLAALNAMLATFALRDLRRMFKSHPPPAP